MKGLHLLVAIFEQLCDKYSIYGNYLICSMAYISADDGGDIPKPNRLLGGLIPGRENFPLLGGTSVARLSCPSSLPQKEVYMSELESTAIVKTLSIENTFRYDKWFQYELVQQISYAKDDKSALVANSGFEGKIFNTHTSRIM